jgi:hypothetical protein
VAEGRVGRRSRHGLIVDVRTTHAIGRAERETAEAMIEAAARGRRVTLGADKAYDAAEHVARLRTIGVTPHVAQNTSGRRSATDGRTTRHPSYAVSQRLRKRIDEPFGWIKPAAGLRKTRHRGLSRVGWAVGRCCQPGARAQAARGRRMITRGRSQLIGKWRIVEMDLWDADYIDMLGPGRSQFDHDGGTMAFGAVQIGLDCHYGADSDHFTFSGHDEMTEVSGDGAADREPDGSITGEIRFRWRDEAVLSPWVV